MLPNIVREIWNIVVYSSINNAPTMKLCILQFLFTYVRADPLSLWLWLCSVILVYTVGSEEDCCITSPQFGGFWGVTFKKQFMKSCMRTTNSSIFKFYYIICDLQDNSLKTYNFPLFNEHIFKR